MPARPNAEERRPRILNKGAGLSEDKVVDALESADMAMTTESTEQKPAPTPAAPAPATADTPAPAVEPTPPEVPTEPQATPVEGQPAEPVVEPAAPVEEPEPAPEPVPEPAPDQVVTIPAAEYEALKKGGLMQADYTRKTQATAAHEKELAQELASVRAERAQYATLTKQLEDTLEVMGGKEPDWADLRQTLSTEQYAERRDQWDAFQKDRTTVKAEQNRVAKKELDDQAKRREAFVLGEQKALLEKRPELKDNATFQTWNGKVVKVAKELGFTDAEINSTADHRLLLLLERAAGASPQPRAPGAVVTKKPPMPTPRSVGPGAATAAAAPKKSLDEARAKHLKEKSVESAGRVFAELDL